MLFRSRSNRPERSPRAPSCRTPAPASPANGPPRGSARRAAPTPPQPTKDVTSLLRISLRELGRLTKSGVLRPEPETVPGPSGGSPAARYTLHWLNESRVALGLPRD